MNNTPNSNRIVISIFGKRNAGKSSLLNTLTNQEISIVSPVKGTTTDPVEKAMELNPIGPVLFIDTAGIDDDTELGNLRIEKSIDIMRRTNIALHIVDINDIDNNSIKHMELLFKKYNIPYILVINKIDTVNNKFLEIIKSRYPEAIFISSTEKINIDILKNILIDTIKDTEKELPIVGDLVPYNGKVVLVIPIDKQAPKGRLILPQAQVIRDCLDHGIKSYIVRDTELESALKDLNDIDLIITDSQIFKKVDNTVPKEIKLTSFSILFARHKGDLKEFIKGIKAIEKLESGADILIAENCTHNTSHEDIGRIKIPKLLKEKTNKSFNFHFKSGFDFSENIKNYDLVIHCGGCMVNRKEIENRMKICAENTIPITNYGIVLAYLNGIIDRSLEIFNEGYTYP